MAHEEPALAAWLRLTLSRGIGGDSQRLLLATFGLPEAIFAAHPASLRKVIMESQVRQLLTPDDEDKLQRQIDLSLQWAQIPGNHLLTLADAAYPQTLLRSDDPPVLLYAKGRIELLNRPALAIVGSRNATPQGLSNASAFASAFAEAGLTVVSGLALGIDTAAHQGALSATGKQLGSTIAMIGTGADRIYPARNQELARQIAQHGLILSEFPLATPALAGNFPRRNRLIAGLSLGCLVVEAAARSGSLITARLASEVGREVFAIPGSIHSPLAKGCHQLIKQGAKLVESAQDVLEELDLSRLAVTAEAPPAAQGEAHTPPEDATALALFHALGHDPCTIDVLVERSQLTAEVVLATLLQLELTGQIAPLPGGRYQRL